MLSALNHHTTQLHLDNTANPAQINSISNLIPITAQIHSKSNSIMSIPKSNPQTPPIHSRVAFQSTPNSAVNSTRSSNDEQTSPNLELSKEEIFENNLTQLFTKGFLAVLTSKDAVLKEVRDCILQNDAQRCKGANPYLYSYWRDLHVRSGCVCVD